MGKIRRVTFKNMIHSGNIRIRRSIDLRELEDFGSIVESPSDLPTAGAAHRADMNGSTSATRNYTDLRSIDITTDVVVDNQDMGTITEIAYDWSKHVYSGGPGGPSITGVRGDATTWGGDGSTSASTSSTTFSFESLTDSDPVSTYNIVGNYPAQNIVFNNDGTIMYTQHGQSTHISKFTLTEPYDISTLTNVRDMDYPLNPSYAGYGLTFNSDGTQFYSPDWESNNSYYFIRRWNTSTAYNITDGLTSTASYAMTTKGPALRTLINNATGIDIGSFGTTSNGRGFNRMTMVDDHKKMFFYDGAQLLVATLPTQDDISSFSWTNNPQLTAFNATNLSIHTDLAIGSWRGFAFNPDGTKLYGTFYYGQDPNVSGLAGKTLGIVEITVPTAFDLSSIVDDPELVKVSSWAGLSQGGTIGGTFESQPYITPTNKLIIGTYSLAQDLIDYPNQISERYTILSWDLGTGETTITEYDAGTSSDSGTSTLDGGTSSDTGSETVDGGTS